MNQLNKISRCLLILLMLTAAISVRSQSVPALVNYQGRLANPDGTPLATADYILTFTIYNSATNSGGLVWGPQIFDGVTGQGHGNVVPVVQGYFNVILGPTDTNGASLSNAFTNSSCYLEITISNRSPILPRQQILSAPYAINSSKLAGADWSALFGTNDPINGKLPTSRLATNGVIIAQQIGVGTSSPGYTLDVSGDFHTLNSGTFGDGHWNNEGPNYTALSTFGGSIIRGNSIFANALSVGVIDQLAPTNGLYVGGNTILAGRLGLGTANPASMLHVLGGSPWSSWNYGASIIADGPFNNAIGILDYSSSNPWAIANDAGKLTFAQMPPLGTTASSGSIRMAFDTNGNVGIASTSPRAKLDINQVLGADFLRLTRADQLSEYLSIAAVAEPSSGTGFAFHNQHWNGGGYDTITPLYLSSSGKVGIGTSSPGYVLDVAGSANISGDCLIGGGFELGQGSPSATPFIDFHFGVSSIQDYNVRIINNNNLTLSVVGVSNLPVDFKLVNGTFWANSLKVTSDRNAKTGFQQISQNQFLDKVLDLPISSWVFKNSPTERHVGPMAQDFKKAFDLNGDDDTHINVTDASGVALASIQGLNQKLEQKIQEQKDEISNLKAQVESLQTLKTRLEALEKKMDRRN